MSDDDARLDEVMGLITGTTTFDEFGDVDFVIEAVPERMEIKKAVYRELDEVELAQWPSLGCALGGRRRG